MYCNLVMQVGNKVFNCVFCNKKEEEEEEEEEEEATSGPAYRLNEKAK